MARVLGCVAALWGASSFLGPLVGGGFVEYATWRWGFGAFALQAVLLGAWIGATRALGARPDPDGASGALPVARIAVLSAGVVLVAYAGLEVGAVATPALIAAGAACLAVFVQLDRRAGTGRLLPARAFDPATVPGSALAMILLYAAGTIALTAYGPVLAVMIHGVSALVAGALVACSAVGWTLAAVLVSGAAPRHDPGFIAGGFSLVLISVLLLAWSMPVGPVWLIALSAVLEGGGFGMAWSFVLRRATAGAPAGEIARISGAVPTVQRLGYALGAGYLGLVANAAGFATAETAGQAAHAARWIFLACLPLALLGFAAMLRFLQLGARGEPAEPASGTGSGIG
jgi:MFS family permease